MTTRPILIPAGLAACLLATIACIQLRAPVPVRFVVVLATLVALPGVAVSYRLKSQLRRCDANSSETAFSLGVGIAWLVLTTEVLLYAHWWKPGALLPASVAFAAIVTAAPSTGATHVQRRSPLNRRWMLCVAAVGGWFVALQVWSLYRAPYRAEELSPIQYAWTSAQGASGGLQRASGSAMSLLFELVIPFQRSTFGTLLATRWLALVLFVLGLVFAMLWVRSLTNWANLGIALAALLVMSAFVQADRLGGVTAVSTPLILASGACLAGRSQMRRRILTAGGILTLAALSSRTGAGAAIGLGLWLVLHAQSWPTIRGVFRTRIAALTVGLLATVTTVAICARIYSFSIPLLNERPVRLAAGSVRLVAVCISVASLAICAFLLDVVVLRSVHARRHRIRSQHAPLLALAGAGLGASLEGRPFSQIAPLLLLLSMVSVTGLAASPDSGIRRTVARSMGASTVGGRSKKLRAVTTGFVALAGLLGGAQTVRATKLSNSAQTRKIAYILERTSPREAVYDPSQAVGVLRPRADRSTLSQAAFAVISDADLERDPALREVLDAAGFIRTGPPGVWAPELQWSTASPAVAPTHVDSIASTDVSSDDRAGSLDWSPPVAVVAEESGSLDWLPPVGVVTEDSASTPDRKVS